MPSEVLPPPVPVSVYLFTKNNATYLNDCLHSVQPFLRPDLGDEFLVFDTGSDDGSPDLARAAGATVHDFSRFCSADMLDGPYGVKALLPAFYEKVAADPKMKSGFMTDFAAARNAAADLCKNDVTLWLDSDDVLIGGEQLREHCSNFFIDPKNHAFFLQYDYSFESDGACNTVLWRERVVRKSTHYWKGACHESLLPRSGVNCTPDNIRKINPAECRVVHKHGRYHIFADVRNYCIMRRDYDQSTWKDPRTEHYLGNCCRGLAEGKRSSPFYREAISWYTRFLPRSGNREDRMAVCLNIGYILLLHGRPWHAIDWFDKAMKIFPYDPRAYYGKARAYHDLKRWEECLLWTQIGGGVGVPEYLVAMDPLSLDFQPRVFEVLALKELKRFEPALQISQKLLQTRPNSDVAKSLWTEIAKEAEKDRVLRSVADTTTLLADTPGSVKSLVRHMKPEVRKSFAEFSLETKAPHPSKALAFLCGNTVEPWDSTSLKSGVGGSEKMVILLARAFAQRGWKVHVYGNTPQGAIQLQDGVTYLPSQAFDSDFSRDIVVIWRAPALLDAVLTRKDKHAQGLRANKVYVDMHDVPVDAEFTETRMDRCAGVFFKSKYHRGLAPSCPDSRAILTRNAVDLPSLLVPAGPRNLQKVIWSSSADRGLLNALHAWRLVRQALPNAELHVFYGFTPLYLTKAAEHDYMHFSTEGTERHMLDYMEECYSLMDELRVTFHGRVPPADLYRHLQEAHLWLYPTQFPEISCMSAMEAQACGAIPIFSGGGALPETVQFGLQVHHDNHEEIAAAVVGMIQKGEELEPHRTEMQTWARQTFDLDSLVSDWEKEFLR